MLDPREGVSATGAIITGASRERIPDGYSDVLDAATTQISAAAPRASVYVYGSVATGTAAAPGSDVDLLTVGVPTELAASISSSLSTDFSDLCRGVEIASAAESDFTGATDEAYGNRVFLHHYCVRLVGPEIDRAGSPFPADLHAARGFNGDIAQHLDRWRRRCAPTDPALLGRIAARKTLLAVAGLVSVNDTTWTTDRTRAADRWGEVRADLAGDLRELLDWTSRRANATSDRITHHLDSTIEEIVNQFEADIGLWPT
ncbi:nucleotidyltransferase domain-containing protein [Ilumatobacter sp.]|uniref:nucleotidyltransferase domain-containing protein n=1 Tax=Ilumatobacter sp. TaxID=1967498 RepID=UPI003B52721C